MEHRTLAEVMTPQPFTVTVGTRLMDAVEILYRNKISELPVVDAEGLSDEATSERPGHRRDAAGHSRPGRPGSRDSESRANARQGPPGGDGRHLDQSSRLPLHRAPLS